MILLQAASNITAAAFVATLTIPVAMLSRVGDVGARPGDRYPQHVLSLRQQSVAHGAAGPLFVTYQPQGLLTAE